ncbi:hypothetical protein BC629DRAFT_136029 [Irpex lacteus]|nr:hypothetical protein BC629DRAFT_136029 [Irpex lacteus]
MQFIPRDTASLVFKVKRVQNVLQREKADGARQACLPNWNHEFVSIEYHLLARYIFSPNLHRCLTSTPTLGARYLYHTRSHNRDCVLLQRVSSCPTSPFGLISESHSSSWDVHSDFASTKSMANNLQVYFQYMPTHNYTDFAQLVELPAIFF